MHYKYETTVIIIKPDGVQRSLIGEVIKRYERVGLKLVGLKYTTAKPETIREHYTNDPKWIEKTGQKLIENLKALNIPLDTEDYIEQGERVLARLVQYMTSCPVVVMAWQGAHAVSVARKITGGTEPRTSDVGTIRGDFMLDSYPMANEDGRSVRNIVHASGTVEEAERELKIWFKDEEIIKYRLIQDEILYDVNLDGILE